MRKIIDGRRYDTDAPRTVEVAYYSNGRPGSDFSHVRETLYRSGGGHWFTEGVGGPMTQYAVRAEGGGTNGSTQLRAMTADEAYDWLEDHGEMTAIDEYFADRVADADEPDPRAAELAGLRERMGYTQSAMANVLGVHPNTYSRAERGAIGVGEPMLRLARILVDQRTVGQ